MLLSNDSILCLMLIPVFTISILRTAVAHLFALGKSKSRCKKLRKSFSLCDKVFLLGFAEETQYHAETARRLRMAYWAALFLFVLFGILCILLLWYPEIRGILSYLLAGRFLLLDIPIWILFFIRTKHGKNGGVVWKWDTNDHG